MNDFNLGILVLCIILLAAAGTYIKKLMNDLRRKKYENETKEMTIIGLKEIIRLLEEKK